MMRLMFPARGPLLMILYPFTDNDSPYDKPVNPVIKPMIQDEMGWDRVKRIFRLTEEKKYTKEFQSIVNLTLSGAVCGAAIGGMSATKTTVNNFIDHNEATKFPSHFDAKRSLQQKVFENFIRAGGRFGGKLGLFCFMFGTVSTCTTAYRGKLTAANYALGGSVAGLLYKMNLGLRAALVGAGLGGVLGLISGNMVLGILWLSGVSMDEVLNAQQAWISSRDELMHEKIKTYMDSKDAMAKDLFDTNKELKVQQKSVEAQKT